MSLLDRLARVDSSMQRGLDNAFAWVFGGKVVPAEIEELLKQEAQDSVRESEDGGFIACNMYAVGVSSKDLENLSQDPGLPESFVDVLARFGRNNGWNFPGPVVVQIGEESGLRTGQLRVSSYMWDDPDQASGFDAIDVEPGAQPNMSHTADTEAEEKDPMDATSAETTVTERVDPAMVSAPDPDKRVVNLLLQDGSSRTYTVHEGSNIIGRSNAADFRLPDTGVSRQHAEITWDGKDAVLVDLMSTNGTSVNQNRVDNWLLADGDVITVGHSQIEVRIVDPGQR